MNEITRIVDQMQRVFSDEAWHGPALRELLANISATQAAARPLPNVHSIGEIVLHILAGFFIGLSACRITNM